MMGGSGIIIPPPDIKNLVDKTAKSVAQKGAELEELVKKNFADNPKFSFLQFNYPYRPYYDQKVHDYKIEAAEGTGDKDGEGEGEEGEDGQRNGDKRVSVRPPPVESKYIYDCGSVGVLENDIIQHTAQFVARNGQRFLIGLTEREKNNPQFEFLKPTHSLFPYFTSLIDSYSKILDFGETDYEGFMSYIADKRAVLRACTEVFEYEAETQQHRRRKEELEEEERAQRAMIDWNDFIVVRTIDFDDNEGALPVPRDFMKENPNTSRGVEFTRANVNPDFASLVDASLVYASREAGKADQGRGQDRNGSR